MIYRLICAVASLFAVANLLSAADVAPSRFPVRCGRPDVWVPYASSQPIDKANSKIDRLIVGIHSSGFNAVQCLNGIRQAAAKVKGASESTLIVAPQFLTVDSIKQRIPDNMMCWHVSPYRGSSLACIGPDKDDIAFSSHNVMDQLLVHVANFERFPNLKTVVVCGHSAGGQMTQRYAITCAARIPLELSLRFVPSGASSYAYLDEKRPRKSGSRVTFRALEGEMLKKYPHYNKWGYGLDERYRAFRRAKEEYYRNRYATRRVLYLCGSQDNDPKDRSMSTNSAAMLQGRHRLERMQLFFKHLIDVYGEDIKKTHAMGVSRGVNHDEFRSYASREALKFLFDDSKVDSDKDGKTDWEEWLAGSE
ncbi:MAG: hypothetical protein CMJ78_23345 [Planctomycetaceae bacterium]|nr:hypothetical protein [Planctomycetaceae bacterium]